MKRADLTEKILDINELVSGVRMHTSFIRVGGLLADVPEEFYDMVRAVIKTFPGLDLPKGQAG